jgi:hypothetical protein
MAKMTDDSADRPGNRRHWPRPSGEDIAQEQAVIDEKNFTVNKHTYPHQNLDSSRLIIDAQAYLNKNVMALNHK